MCDIPQNPRFASTPQTRSADANPVSVPLAAQAGKRHKPKAAAEGETQVSGGGKSLHMTD